MSLLAEIPAPEPDQGEKPTIKNGVLVHGGRRSSYCPLNIQDNISSFPAPSPEPSKQDEDEEPEVSQTQSPPRVSPPPVPKGIFFQFLGLQSKDLLFFPI